MALPPNTLTLKREYLEHKIQEYARGAGVPIDALRWNRPANCDVSELIIRSAGRERAYILSHTDDPPSPGLLRLTNSDLDLLADNIVKGWQ